MAPTPIVVILRVKTDVVADSLTFPVRQTWHSTSVLIV